MLAEVEAQAETQEKHLERQLCESRGVRAGPLG